MSVSVTPCADEEPCDTKILVAFSGVSDVMAFDPDTHDLTFFTSGLNLSNAISIAVDQADGFVFVTDVRRDDIWRVDFKTPAPGEIIHHTGAGTCPAQ